MKRHFYNPGKDYFDRLELEYHQQRIPLIDKIVGAILFAVGLALIYWGL